MIKLLKTLRYEYKVEGLMRANGNILARIFNRPEIKRLAYGVFVGCFVMVLIMRTVFQADYGNLPMVPYVSRDNISESILNHSNSRSRVHEINGDIRIHGRSSTIYVASTHPQNTTTYNFTTKPYARQQDGIALAMVTSFKIMKLPHEDKMIPHCTRNLTMPAIVFSTGGHAGNHFHDFTDVLIPLYLTSQQFNCAVLFLVADKLPEWIRKYKSILDNLSKHEVIDIDNDDEILCFPRAIVGLKANKEMSIDRSQPPHYSLTDFTRFLRTAYSLDRNSVNSNLSSGHRPRLLIVSRETSRHVTNEAAVADMARSLGFEVDAREMGDNLLEISRFVNTFDVMMGVHGAGFTNMVFLPENAVVILIDPIGMDVLSESFFQAPAMDMNLKFLGYKVSPNESSLMERYPVDSEVFRDPQGIRYKGWIGFRSIYLDNQDLNLDLGRFNKTLVKALELLDS